MSDSGVRRYLAFISYSHRDRRWARWLHRAIETYALPKRLNQQVNDAATAAGRLGPLFLDREELSTAPDLALSVRSALEHSRFLIVVCSPDAARSRWVNEEVRLFKALGGAERILCLIVAGDPTRPARLVDPDLQDCFPPALRFAVVDGQLTDIPAGEPLAADVREGMDGPRDARLKIVAGLLGLKLDELRQRDQVRRQKRLMLLATASVTGCVILAGLATAALLARNEAQRQRIIAEQQSLTARRTADFMKSLFVVSDPSEARGAKVTAREILDRGVRQIDSGLRDEPLVRADLSTTLGEVYTGLGLYKSGAELLAKARAVPGQDGEPTARQSIALGDIQYLQGNYDRADELYRAGLTELDRRGGSDPELRTRALTGRGEVLTALERYDEAQALLQQSNRLVPATSTGGEAAVARNIEDLAAIAFYQGNLDTAEREFRRALEMRIRSSGELHPKVPETLSALGSIEYMRGDNAAAEQQFSRALAIYRQVLDQRHPDIAMALNNLARTYVERRQFTKAAPLLEESLTINLAEKDETNDNLSFVYSNLALVRMGQGQLNDAHGLLEKALAAAVRNNHRLHGPILTDLAELDCRTGRYDQGIAHLTEARPLIAARYPNDAWRAALVDSVQGGCLTGKRDLRHAEPLLASSTGTLLEKWGRNGLYGRDALERVRRLQTLNPGSGSLARFLDTEAASP